MIHDYMISPSLCNGTRFKMRERERERDGRERWEGERCSGYKEGKEVLTEIVPPAPPLLPLRHHLNKSSNKGAASKRMKKGKEVLTEIVTPVPPLLPLHRHHNKSSNKGDASTRKGE